MTLLDNTTEYLLSLGELYFDISVIFQCLNYYLYPRVLSRMPRWTLE